MATLSSYQHQAHQHCESGSTSNLLQAHGITLSEAMAFGIGSGLLFSYVPLIKLMDGPFLTYRHLPGKIFSNVAKNLGIGYEIRNFSSQSKAQATLDERLSEGKPIGLVTNMLHLSYMPEMFRLPFNFHNLVVLRKDDNKYLISDSILEVETYLDEATLLKSRFDKGSLTNPKGKLYYIKQIPADLDIASAVYKGIQTTANNMLKPLNPFVGINAILKLAKDIKKYPQKYSQDKASALLLHIVRIQEILGTGGAGFRHIYANFLKEAGELLNNAVIKDAAIEMESIALDWRKFALFAGKIARRNGLYTVANINLLHDDLVKIANKEKQLFQSLKSMPKL